MKQRSSLEKGLVILLRMEASGDTKHLARLADRWGIDHRSDAVRNNDDVLVAEADSAVQLLGACRIVDDACGQPRQPLCNSERESGVARQRSGVLDRLPASLRLRSEMSSNDTTIA